MRRPPRTTRRISLEDALIDAGVISITITGEDGIRCPKKFVEIPVDKTLPRYEYDGSIVLTMTFGGDFTIGDNVQSSGKSIFERELDRPGRGYELHLPQRERNFWQPTI